MLGWTETAKPADECIDTQYAATSLPVIEPDIKGDNMMMLGLMAYCSGELVFNCGARAGYNENTSRD
jgi:hypothetical protein